MNGAMVEVSGKNNHSGLGGFAWEQGTDVFSFDGLSDTTESDALHLMSVFLAA